MVYIGAWDCDDDAWTDVLDWEVRCMACDAESVEAMMEEVDEGLARKNNFLCEVCNAIRKSNSRTGER